MTTGRTVEKRACVCVSIYLFTLFISALLSLAVLCKTFEPSLVSLYFARKIDAKIVLWFGILLCKHRITIFKAKTEFGQFVWTI